jgi:hypothetical protein
MFDGQTGLLSYKCCKAFLKNALKLVQILVNCKAGNAQYVDGMDDDIHNEERLVMESSGGPIKKSIRHTSDDTLKQIQSFTAILSSNIAHNMDASFIIMKKSLAIGIQLAKLR